MECAGSVKQEAREAGRELATERIRAELANEMLAHSEMINGSWVEVAATRGIAVVTVQQVVRQRLESVVKPEEVDFETLDSVSMARCQVLG